MEKQEKRKKCENRQNNRKNPTKKNNVTKVKWHSVQNYQRTAEQNPNDKYLNICAPAKCKDKHNLSESKHSFEL